jgi:hypothetical protein
MGRRACASGISLSEGDAAIAKGMLARGDRQHDIAAWFGVNAGRIAEIATGFRFARVEPAAAVELPPAGPYPAGRVAVAAITALSAARAALSNAEMLMRTAR